MNAALVVSTVAFAAVVGLAGLCYYGLRRASAGRRRLSVEIHDQALRLDRRLDAVEARLAAAELRARLAHLDRLLGACRRAGRLDAATASALDRYLLGLADEAAAATSADRR